MGVEMFEHTLPTAASPNSTSLTLLLGFGAAAVVSAMIAWGSFFPSYGTTVATAQLINSGTVGRICWSALEHRRFVWCDVEFMSCRGEKEPYKS